MKQLLPDIGYIADRKFSLADININISIGRSYHIRKRSGCMHLCVKIILIEAFFNQET